MSEPSNTSEARRFGHVGRDAAVLTLITTLVIAGYTLFSQPRALTAENELAGHPEAAADDMSQAMQGLGEWPEDFETLVTMGNDFMDRSQFAVAAECYKRALERGESPDVRVDFGACLNRMGLPARALEEFRQVLSEHPDHLVANFNCGVVYYGQNQFDSARVCFQRCVQLQPEGEVADQARRLLEEIGG